MKKVFKLLPFLILVIALIGGVFLVNQVQETRRGAAGDDLDLILSPDILTMSAGEERNNSPESQNKGSSTQPAVPAENKRFYLAPPHYYYQCYEGGDDK